MVFEGIGTEENPQVLLCSHSQVKPFQRHENMQNVWVTFPSSWNQPVTHTNPATWPYSTQLLMLPKLEDLETSSEQLFLGKFHLCSLSWGCGGSDKDHKGTANMLRSLILDFHSHFCKDFKVLVKTVKFVKKLFLSASPRLPSLPPQLVEMGLECHLIQKH